MTSPSATTPPHPIVTTPSIMNQVVCNMCAKVIFEVIASFDISQSYYYYLFCSACNVLSFYVNDFAKWTESNAVLYIRCE